MTPSPRHLRLPWSPHGAAKAFEPPIYVESLRTHFLLSALLGAIALVLASCGASPSAEELQPSSLERSAGSESVEVSAPATGSASGELRVYFVDVGQGSSAVLVSPEGRVVVYDAGTRRGGQATVGLLNELGIQRVDLAILSHAHNDHLGGFLDVIEQFEVMRFMDPGFEHDSQVYLRLLDALAAREIPIFIGETGRRVRIDASTELELLAPSQPFLRGTRSDVNSNSIVVRVDFGNHSILLTGDAEAPTEARLVSEGNLTPVDVLLVAHHGSAHSSTTPFLEAVQARYAVIQSGAGNSYGHPAEATLERLRDSGVEQVFRNDLHGTIELRTDGETLRFIPERSPPQDQ